MLEGLKSGNIAETCRRDEIAPNLNYRWKERSGSRSQGCAWGEKQPRGPMRSRRSGSSNWSGRWAIPICKKRAGRVSCGQAHSSARELVAQGKEALSALNRAVLEALPCGPRRMGLTLTTDDGTQFTSARYFETLQRLGITPPAHRLP